MLKRLEEPESLRRKVVRAMGRPIHESAPIGRLAVAMGGVTALAEALGVSVRTIRYWARGEKQPGGPALKLLAALFKKHGISPG